MVPRNKSITRSFRSLAFGLFFVSGFCGLVYEVVWMRLALSDFGAITPVVSVVVSIFMLGLALGSWAGGRSISILAARTGRPGIFFYGLAEAGVALGAVAVPSLFAAANRALLGLGETHSGSYLLLSAVALGLSILPWTFLMGTTFPFMMHFLRERLEADERSFSFLYLANVIGAVLGAALPAFVLIELNGFRGTLLIAGKLNIAAALLSLAAARRFERRRPRKERSEATPSRARAAGSRHLALVLFATGFAAMACEVIWTRAYGGPLGSTTYAFALILVAYLAATCAGSWIYRAAGGARADFRGVLVWVAPAALLPLFLGDPRLGLGFWGVALGISALCGLLGFLTPRLIDEYSKGDALLAGRAYALNTMGCILGPLAASYLLLPAAGERQALVALAAGLALLSLNTKRTVPLLATVASLVLGATCGQTVTESFDDPGKVVRHDYAATVVSTGRGLEKQLVVNGIGMTVLTTITKLMVHFPLALRPTPPRSVLVICFGMGTSFRSALTWDARTTAVELIPSVPQAFGYYHADAAQVLANPLGRVVIDDGRRYLARTSEKFDLIVIDPPPPETAAGSGMLYSTEFYRLARQHLSPGGVLQQWYPGVRGNLVKALVRSITKVFPDVRLFWESDTRGVHFLASEKPLELPAPELAIQRLPARAKADLAEWLPPGLRLEAVVAALYRREEKPSRYLVEGESQEVTDDQPYNEYYLLREPHVGL